MGDQDVVHRFTFSNSILKYLFWQKIAENVEESSQDEHLNRGFRGQKIDCNKFQEPKVTKNGDVGLFRLCLSSYAILPTFGGYFPSRID